MLLRMDIMAFLILTMAINKKTLGYNFCDRCPPEVFPEDYDKFEPPWDKENPAHVYLKLNVMDIDKISDDAMEYSLQSYLIEIWKDQRLNLSLFTENDVLIFPTYLAKYAWIPDLVFDNTRDGKLFHLSLPNTSIKINKDGSFFRSSRYNLVVGCQMNFRLYPMDTQECFLKIATMSNPDFKVLLHWTDEHPTQPMKSIQLMNDIQPLMYVLSDPVSHKATEVWTAGNFTYLYANFTFVRRLSGSVFNVYIPSTLVVSLSWISFWLDVEAVPARITLGVTSVLTLSTQVAEVHTRLPAISYMTAVDVWLFACLVMVFCSLVEYALAYQFFIEDNRQTSTDKSSSSAGSYSTKHKVSIFQPISHSNAISSNPRINRSTCFKTSGPPPVEEPRQKRLDTFCRKLFPSLFSMFLFSYWIYFLNIK